MKQFTIDDTNYQTYTRNNCITLDENFFLETHIPNDLNELVIHNINNSTVKFHICNFQRVQLKLKIENCSLEGLFLTNIELESFNLKNVTINEHTENKFSNFKFYIDNSKIINCRIYYSSFFRGFLIRNKSEINDINLYETFIEKSFTFINSQSKTIEIESSVLDNFFAEAREYPVAGLVSKSDKINIFRTKIISGINITNSFNEISIHKIRLSKVDKLNDYDNQIYISASANQVNSIKITESLISQPISLIGNELNSLILSESSLGNCRIFFNTIIEQSILTIQFQDEVNWGGHFVSFNKYESLNINNCNFEKQIYLCYSIFKKKLNIEGCTFQMATSFFIRNIFMEHCQVTFSYTNLSNFVFQEIKFDSFSFKNFDITNATFHDCEWKTEKIYFSERSVILDENTSNSIDELISVKSIYSKFVSNFQKTSDFLNYSRFHISEQEIKRKIMKEKEDRVEYILLSLHRFISSYGENFKQPLLLALIILLIFSFLYLITGFKSNNILISYNPINLLYVRPNIYLFIKDWILAILFSLKALLPFSLNNDFFLSSDSSLNWTQVLELIHKLINLILAASFTTSVIRYLKK